MAEQDRVGAQRTKACETVPAGGDPVVRVHVRRHRFASLELIDVPAALSADQRATIAVFDEDCLVAGGVSWRSKQLHAVGQGFIPVDESAS